MKWKNRMMGGSFLARGRRTTRTASTEQPVATRPAPRQHPLGIRLICLQKSIWGAALLAIAAALFTLYALRETEPFQDLFEGELAQDPHDWLANLVIGLVPHLSLQAELLLASVALVYAVLEGVEVWGLWTDRLWVELLVVVETAAFLPYEFWEITQHFSPFKVLSIIINLLIVWYLVARYLRRKEERLVRDVAARLHHGERDTSAPPARQREGAGQRG